MQSFQGVNRRFVLSFENENDRTSHSTYYLSKVEIKDYNVMINGRNFFDQPIDSMAKTYENIGKVAIDHGDDYTTGCILDYAYFKENYKLITIDRSRSKNELQIQELFSKLIFKINVDRAGNTTIFLLLKKQKKLFSNFPTAL